MKKLIAVACCAMAFGMSAFAADPQYKVYDVTMKLKTTKAGGKVVTSCGMDYLWRTKTKGDRKIKGIIAGCGCMSVVGDGTALDAAIYFWDETTKIQLKNFTYTTELIQRIGKDGKQVEQVVTFVVTDPDGEKYELQLAGFGTYKVSSLGANYDAMSIKGNVTGVMDAPYKVTPGGCCGNIGGTDQTTAVPICEDGICSVSASSDVTPVFGTYAIKYNDTKSKACVKKGIGKDTLGLPSYVDL